MYLIYFNVYTFEVNVYFRNSKLYIHGYFIKITIYLFKSMYVCIIYVIVYINVLIIIILFFSLAIPLYFMNLYIDRLHLQLSYKKYCIYIFYL